MYVFYRYTAVSVVEMDFDRIDINQCPIGLGNNGANKFNDTARCKKGTTEVCTIKVTFCLNWKRYFGKNYDFLV